MHKPIYLLDAGIISELAKPEPNQNLVKKITENKNQCAISCTTWSSLLFGLENLEEGKLKDYYNSFLLDYLQSEFPILNFDVNAAAIQADIRTKTRTADLLIDYEDIQNLAIAISNQMIFVTRKITALQPVQKLTPMIYLENWME